MRLILRNIVWSQHVQKFRRENSSLQIGKEPTCLVVACTSSVPNTHLSFMISPIFNPAFRKSSSLAALRVSVSSICDHQNVS